MWNENQMRSWRMMKLYIFAWSGEASILNLIFSDNFSDMRNGKFLIFAHWLGVEEGQGNGFFDVLDWTLFSVWKTDPDLAINFNVRGIT